MELAAFGFAYSTRSHLIHINIKIMIISAALIMLQLMFTRNVFICWLFILLKLWDMDR